jgi:cell division septation protein DedD
MNCPTRRLRHGPGGRPADRPGTGAGRGAVHHQGPHPLHQQGAAAHRRAGHAPRPNATATGTPTRPWPASRWRGRPAAGLQASRGGRGGHAARRPVPAPGRCPRGQLPRPGAKDPAAILAGGGTARAAAAPSRSRSGDAGPPPAADAFVYFVQAGAFTRSEDAEQQRARLGLIGQVAKITEREQAGRTVYRVRWGPSRMRDEADGCRPGCRNKASNRRSCASKRP